VEFGGVKLAVDRMSAPYLQGAEIGYADQIDKQGFTIENPNAGGSCSCGDSFN
jgi:iron-sulfur cluster assembly accessory protein